MLPVTAFFAGILAFFYLVLTYRVIFHRRKMRISLGDGGDAVMLRRMRVHGNFAEYIPFALLLMVINELNGRPHWLLSIMGVALILGRFAHIYGIQVSQVANPTDVRFRALGMILTTGVIAILGLAALL